MDEIGDEFNDESGNDEAEEELPELTSESDKLNEFGGESSEVFSEPDEFDDDIPEVFSEPDEFDDDIPEVFNEPDEFDDDIPEVFNEPDEFDDDIPEVFNEPDEFDDDIPDVFGETDEFNDIIPDVFSEPDEFDDIIPEVFSETDEIDDILDDTIQNKEDGERADEDQDSGDVGNVIENENIGSQSTSTVLTGEVEEIEEHMEHQEQEEEIQIRPEEYQDDTEPIVNTDEIEFIKDVEELAEHAREIKAEDECVEPQAEKENAAYYAEQYYEKLKEKEVVSDQNSKEEQETEELRQGVTEESKEITSTEEFEYLWEIRDKLDREEKSPEEIEEVMHEAEEMYETLKNAEKLYEEQVLEKLKLVDHEDEASEEDLKEDLDREDLLEQAVELEENLVQQGESQEDIDIRVEESIETTKFEEKLETLIEEQEREKLKLVDHEDEASEEDLKEDLDRVDLIEQAVELEENLVQQGESQEDIDIRVEESIETTKFEEKLETLIEQQESIVNKKLKKHDLEINEQNSNENVENKENLETLKPELDAIESESESNKDFLEESTKIVSEESDEEETEHLQELYRQETGRRPIYSRKKTNGYSQWLEQRELRSEKIKISKSESEKKKEIEEEGWKTTLKQWIKEASEEECNAELKSELKKALESYNEFEDLTRKFMELCEKSQYEKLSEKEKNILKSLTERLQGLGPIQLELLANIRAFKGYFYNHLWELMNRFFVIRVRSKFFKNISQKYKELRKEQENEELYKENVILNGYNYVRNEILREHKGKVIYSKILEYADIVLKKQIKLGRLPLYRTAQVRLTTQQKLVDIYEGKDYMTKKDEFYEFVNKHRDYEALVYLIKCKNGFPDNWFKGKKYFGYTHSTEKIRFKSHIREAIEQNMDYQNGYRSEEPTKLNRAICIALEDFGYRINEICYLFEVEDVYSQIKFLEKLAYELEENYFDVINLAFHKKLNTAIKHEIKVIKKNGTRSELNELGGGQGGLPYISLPLYDIVGMIALGCTQKRIWKIINKLYKNDFNREKIAENTLRRRIIEEFKGWVNAQKLFLKPMVEALVYEGFSDRKIFNTLSSPHSREGWLYAWWKNGEELDFRFWSELDERKIKNILKNSKEKYCGIPKSKWEEWVIKEVPNYEIAKVTKLTFDTIVSVYKNIFGGRNNILFKYRRETTIKMREGGMSLKDIYTSIFNKTYYPSNFKRCFKTWFEGMTPKQIEERWGPNNDRK